MMSPEAYVKENLEGKTASEIFIEIIGIKEEIDVLEELEAPEAKPEIADRLSVYRQYLAKAEEALTAAQNARPAAEEVAAFDANLPSIEKIVFSIDSYLGGGSVRTVTFEDDQVNIDVTYFLLRDDRAPVEIQDTKETFLQKLSALRIGQWQKEYFSYGVLDGTRWNLEIYFANGAEKVEKSGRNDFPDNFGAFCELMGVRVRADEDDVDE